MSPIGHSPNPSIYFLLIFFKKKTLKNIFFIFKIYFNINIIKNIKNNLKNKQIKNLNFFKILLPQLLLLKLFLSKNIKLIFFKKRTIQHFFKENVLLKATVLKLD
jgi:hypothetical protein